MLVFWDWFLTYLAFRWRGVRRFLRPAPLLLLREGQPIEANMRRELITHEELQSAVRLQGIEDLRDVAYVFLETDGRVSVIPREGKGSSGEQERKGE